MLANKAIRRVHDFTYLGSNVSEDGGTRKYVETRIQKTRKYGWHIISIRIQR
jgi:hypothetical protein